MKNYIVSVECHDFLGIKYNVDLFVKAENEYHVKRSCFMIFANEISKMKTFIEVQRMSIIKIKQHNVLPKEKFKIN